MAATVDTASLSALGNAAAGHDGILVDTSGAIVVKPCTPAEVEFYEITTREHPEFAALMPQYMGTLQLGKSEQLQRALAQGTTEEIVLSGPDDNDAGVAREAVTERSHGKRLDTELSIVLENTTAGFVRPNVMDLKLGARLWADDADIAKRKKLDEVAAETTSGSMGFRVAGMQVWRPSEARFLTYDKFYGRGLKAENVKDAFAALIGVDGIVDEDMVDVIDAAVEEIQTVVESQESRMYSSSILLVVEGDGIARKAAIEEAIRRTEEGRKKDEQRGETDGIVVGAAADEDDEDEDEDNDEPKLKKLVDAKLIDFAHSAWTPGLGRDENILRGIRSVRQVLKQLKRRPAGGVQ